MERKGIPEYNILLMGETGVGKTLLINSFVNYVQHQTLADAQNNRVSVVIPIKFKITDDNDKEHVIEEGVNDGNECLEQLAYSSTTKCKSYLINFGAFRVRLIDSPGVGSTVVENSANNGIFDKHSQGVEQDQQYVQSVLTFISQFKHLHAIAIVVKASETKYTTRFELCLKQLLSSFNKSAIDNLFFILTFGGNSNFKADTVKEPLKELLDKVTASTSDVLLSQDKVYCLDNKGFRYLLAVNNGAWFKDLHRMVCENAWEVSVNECNRLIDYIRGEGDRPALHPHLVTDTLSINEARTFITIVEDLIEDILKIINQNKNTLQELLSSSTKEDEQIAEFQRRLNAKQLDVEVINLEKPQTVCTAERCTVSHGYKTHYKNVCCRGCLPGLSVFARDGQNTI